ncbi:hypothetical protein CYMTET_43519 [Cymbomonas tetramitiformis]|uniref:Uncharacterized protein n=1 Tax=Cymbomonas tetramitiformis TaxID=36881 RepID=A0AAE0F0G8_9CHLO|nr:hypothetical protein CYMTET_43519 [Cymbomonas tetramitiformis]
MLACNPFAIPNWFIYVRVGIEVQATGEALGTSSLASATPRCSTSKSPTTQTTALPSKKKDAHGEPYAVDLAPVAILVSKKKDAHGEPYAVDLAPVATLVSKKKDAHGEPYAVDLAPVATLIRTPTTALGTDCPGMTGIDLNIQTEAVAGTDMVDFIDVMHDGQVSGCWFAGDQVAECSANQTQDETSGKLPLPENAPGGSPRVLDDGACDADVATSTLAADVATSTLAADVATSTLAADVATSTLAADVATSTLAADVATSRLHAEEASTGRSQQLALEAQMPQHVRGLTSGIAATQRLGPSAEGVAQGTGQAGGRMPQVAGAMQGAVRLGGIGLSAVMDAEDAPGGGAGIGLGPAGSAPLRAKEVQEDELWVKAQATKSSAVLEGGLGTERDGLGGRSVSGISVKQGRSGGGEKNVELAVAPKRPKAACGNTLALLLEGADFEHSARKPIQPSGIADAGAKLTKPSGPMWQGRVCLDKWKATECRIAVHPPGAAYHAAVQEAFSGWSLEEMSMRVEEAVTKLPAMLDLSSAKTKWKVEKTPMALLQLTPMNAAEEKPFSNLLDRLSASTPSATAYVDLNEPGGPS